MRALIVRLGSIGDIVHAMPMVGALRGHAPGAEVDWVVEASLAGVVRMCPGVSRIVTMRTRRGGGADGWWPTVARLRSSRYDVAFDAQGLLKSALLARLSGAARVVGWSRAHLREGAAALFYTDRVEAAGAAHVVDKNLSLLRAVGVGHVSRDVVLNAGPESADVAGLVSRTGGRYALVNAGANWPNKRWPPDRFGELAAWLRAQHGLVPVVLWGPGDERLAEAVVTASRGAAVRAPETTLGDIVHLAARAAVVVSGDTGPLHLACAAGARLVGIFGPTDPRRNGSWHAGDEHVSRFQICACHHRRACRARRWCLDDIGVAEVQEAVAKRLASASSGAAL
jgi:heptosyltransferase-1